MISQQTSVDGGKLSLLALSIVDISSDHTHQGTQLNFVIEQFNYISTLKKIHLMFEQSLWSHKMEMGQSYLIKTMFGKTESSSQKSSNSNESINHTIHTTTTTLCH